MITLDDIVENTVFTRKSDGQKYKKGSSCTYGEEGYTICHPFKGGMFQTKPAFETKVLNNEEVSLI